MNAGLKRNMGNMTLPARVTTEVLPEELAYACQSWAYHICPNGTFKSSAIETLVVFLHTHLLHWFEAMSLLNKSAEILPMLQRVATWLEENTFEDKSLGNLVIEAIDFSRKFAADITEHPLYVYYTALPSFPSDSKLCQLFHDSLIDPLVLIVPPHGPVRISAETAALCLLIMNAGLKRNICNMILSVRLTTDVLPEELAYACQSWVDHICTDETFGPWVMEKLVGFLRTHLLHWFEAMSLLKKSEEIVPMLQRVATRFNEENFEGHSLKDFFMEAINFARKFAADITEHPLFVYYTSLPFISSHSILYQLFHDSLVDPSVLLMPSAHVLTRLRCMAFSTNGRRLVTGSHKRVTVWSTATGEELLKMADMDGLAFPMSVVFSYDGSRIACGTDESTVYVWDSGTSVQVIGTLSHFGRSRHVNALAWSTDGERLLSGCRTGEVNLWDVTVLEGNLPITKIHHPGCGVGKQPLQSVAFSLDGSQIASCSQQGGVHVWDSQTGGIVWSLREPGGSAEWVSVSFLSGDMGEFLLAQTKERTQARDASTGDLCPLPNSLAGAVGLTRGDFMVKLLIQRIKRHCLTRGMRLSSPPWAAQREYFAFSEADDQCHVVHLPKLLL